MLGTMLSALYESGTNQETEIQRVKHRAQG